MISVNSKIHPYKGDPINGGKYTAYQVMNKKRIMVDGYPKMYANGWVTIIAEGCHPCAPKSGAEFKILAITGVDLHEWPKGSGNYKPTIFAEIEWAEVENRNAGHLEDDIPEDY